MKVALTVSLAGLTCLAVAVVAAPVNPTAVQPGNLIARPIILPQPVPLLVARAEVVVAGKVAKIEDKTVSAAPYPGAPNKVEYQIAVLKVEDPILNAKGLKEIRVGFIPPPNGAIPIRGGMRPVTLVEDEEALLFLTKNADGDFYTIPGIQDAIKKAATDYKDKVEEAKKDAKLLADPMASLKSKEAEERFITAAMLIERYRTQKHPTGNPPKQEPIDAAESKLILETLRDADWAPPAQPKPGLQLSPLNSFLRLGVNKDDGWMPPAPGTNYADAAKEWLKDNADKYRIKKYVAEKKDDEKKDK